MTRFHLRQRLTRLKQRLRGEWRWIGIPSLIFLLSLSFFVYVLKEPISLASFIPGYIGLVLFLILFVKIFYSKEIFLRVYRVVLHPIAGALILLTILGIFLRINLEMFAFVLGFVWIFSSALFASFVAFIWLHSLRKGEHPLQTAWVYRPSQNFKWYIIISLVTILASVLWFSVRPLPLFLATYFMFLSYYFIILFIATLGFFAISNDDIRKYCEIGLTEVGKGLEFYGEGGHEEKKIFLKKYLPIFSTVVNRFNELAEEYYPDLRPRIPDSDLYVKALFASAVKGESSLKKAREGIDQMIEALKVSKLRKPINFIGFIEGLCVIEGKKPEFPNIPEAFKIQPSFEKSLRKIKSPAALAVIISIFGILISVYVPVRISAPESGYKFIRDSFLGEDFARWLFPIGEARIELQNRYVELLPSSWGGEGRLRGESYGEYLFHIKNEHYKNIEIENVNIAGPVSIKWISMGVPDNMKELIEVKIKSSEIRSPADRIIHKDSRENVTIVLAVEYDLRALGEYFEENPPDDYLSVYGGGVQISVSYEIWGTDLRLNISKNMVREHTDIFNFLFSPAFFS